MKVDQAATKAARKRHDAGVKQLKQLFDFRRRLLEPFNPQTGKAVGATKVERVRWRQWRDSTFPGRAHRRRRRKIAAASRRRNRA